MQLLGGAEYILRADLDSIFSVNKDQTYVSHAERSVGISDEIVGSRTVNDIELLIVELCVKDGGEH